MASGLYSKFIDTIATSGGINLTSDTIKAVLIDTADYTVNLATDDFLNDVASGARATNGTGTLANKTFTGRVFDADDVVLTSVTGDSSEAIVIYKDTGVESTSPLIAYIEITQVTPNGGNITLQWDSGANKIFKI